VVGREFQFPIDIAERRHITTSVDDNQIRSFADDLVSLTTKCREIYKILIEEHRALHRERRNSQLQHAKKFNINDIVFTNVQVQSNAKKGRVKKLSYSRRGPYKIVKSHPSGSYDLQLLHNPQRAITKKHGSELIICPKELVPMQPLDSSDQRFSNLNKKPSENPYQGANIQGYIPVQPWAAAPAAVAEIPISTDEPMPEVFPTVEQLDNEIDSWPESVNPFSASNSEKTTYNISGRATSTGPTSIINAPTDLRGDDQQNAISTALSTPSINPTFAQIIRSIISSDDKLLFIQYRSHPDNQSSEWKLVRINLSLSMDKHPQCLQDGKFIAEFYIVHPSDANSNLPDKRFWLEYHEARYNNISTKYHLIRPSDLSENVAASKNLAPYREWINIKHNNIIIHGPFEFATRHQRKSRDKIDCADWDELIKKESMYDNLPPRYISRTDIAVEWNCPVHMICNNQEVTDRIYATITEAHFSEVNNVSLMSMNQSQSK
jgi:hypothetical protein